MSNPVHEDDHGTLTDVLVGDGVGGEVHGQGAHGAPGGWGP